MNVSLGSSQSPLGPAESASLAEVLAELAETAAETLELQEVFDRVAESVRRLIPFDNLGVVRIVAGERAILHATTVPCAEHLPECCAPEPLDSWSPRLRPRPGPIPRVRDAAAELDPAYPVDAMLLAKGVSSSMWEPFRMGGSFYGGVWLSSFREAAFTDEHQEMLRPIAALLGSAVEHWRIWDAERQRRERLERLEAMLGTLADSLDVREVFGRISTALHPILDHDCLVLTELDAGRRTLTLVAVAGQADIEPPLEPLQLTAEEIERGLVEYELLDDLQSQVPPSSELNRLLLASGMRSRLRVPIRLRGEVRGSLVCLDRRAGTYLPQDVEILRRLADRIALGLSHHLLAEQARMSAEARERAERLEATVETLTRELETRHQGRVVGASAQWRGVLLQVGRVAPSETTVLVTGESGTGKEIVSHLIRQGSPRASKPLVAVNCAALPEQLLESELFGHEKGAFTGAVASKIGRLEQAAGGTLFLDEIGEMSPLLQAKFLRVLQEREFQRVGGTRTLRADVRVVAATNRDLQHAIAQGRFREDLYYRLNVFEIRIPPLRERRDDILPLADVFLGELGAAMGRPAAGISRDAREWLLAYSWPGNVRELRNAIERAILLCDGGLITREHLPAVVGQPESARAAGGNGTPAGALDPSSPLPAGGVDLEELERSLIEKALRDTRGNKAKASRLLGLTRAQLYSRIEKYGIAV